MTDLDYDDWFTLLQWTINIDTPTGSIHLRACAEARKANIANLEPLLDNQYRCPANVPIPNELLFLTIFSFLGVYCFFKRGELSKFIRISTFNR